jgi:hypothetical protein
MITKKTNLKTMPYAQATVTIFENNDMILRSYTTDVIIISDGWMSCTGTYSQTTRRHISAFMREYNFGDYQLAKFLYQEKIKINIYTGEVLPI